MQDFKKRCGGGVTGKKEMYRVRKAMKLETAGTAAYSTTDTVLDVSNYAPPSSSFEILHLSGGNISRLDAPRKQHLFRVPFVENGGVDSVTWRNPLEILKGRECGVNGTVDA